MLNGVVEVNDLQKQILASEAAEAKKEQQVSADFDALDKLPKRDRN